MSDDLDFHVKIECKTCYGKPIKHLCANEFLGDDVPGIYTVTCTECGRTPIRGVTYDKLKELLSPGFIDKCIIPE